MKCLSCNWTGEPDQLKRLIETSNISCDQPCLCPECGSLKIRVTVEGETMQCNIEQQSDEFYCSTCNRRWSVNEDKPPRCRIASVKYQIMMIEMTGRITGREKDRYQSLKKELGELTS